MSTTTDYERIAAAIAFIVKHQEKQPGLDEIARHVELSSFHFQRLFSRWAGVSPKRFLQAVTLERSKRLLRARVPVFDASLSVGLSSGSRLHDHFVQLEAVTPGEFKSGGAGLCIRHAVHDTPFGRAFVALTQKGVCGFAFLDSSSAAGTELAALQARWPRATLEAEYAETELVVHAMFARQAAPDKSLSLHVSGTNFQVSVWRALLAIQPGQLASYGDVAKSIGRPRAARAIGQAVGANPVAFLIPCHRVIQGTGALGGYRWGEIRKRTILARESTDE